MIYVVRTNRNRILQDFLDFNDIDVQNIDLWCEAEKRTSINVIDDASSHANHVLCIDTDILANLLGEEKSKLEFIIWLQHNKVFVSNDIDSYHNLVFGPINHLLDLWDAIPNDNLMIHLDADPGLSVNSRSLSNFDVRIHPTFHLQLLRIKNSQVSKNHCQRVFMMTAIDKPNRPHRNVFMQKISQHPALIENSLLSWRSDSDRYTNWVGECHNFNLQVGKDGWPDGCASMDLYLQSWWEIVPETFCDGSLYITEKTIKAISTMTPFLTVASQWQLRYLRQLGFQTFSPFIDESYDREPDLYRRIDKIISTMTEILSQDQTVLYQKIMPILQHNHRHLARLYGLKTFNNDQFYHACLRDLQQIDQ